MATTTRSNHIRLPYRDDYRLVLDDAVLTITRSDLVDGLCFAVYAREPGTDFESGPALRSMKITYKELENGN